MSPSSGSVASRLYEALIRERWDRTGECFQAQVALAVEFRVTVRAVRTWEEAGERRGAWRIEKRGRGRVLKLRDTGTTVPVSGDGTAEQGFRSCNVHRNGRVSTPEQQRQGAGTTVPPTPRTRRTRSTPRPVASPAPRHQELIGFWMSEFERATGTPYAFQRAKDGAHIKGILEAAGGDLEVAKKRALALLNSPDPYYREKGVDLGTLRSQWNRLGSAGRIGKPSDARPSGPAYQRFVPPDPEA